MNTQGWIRSIIAENYEMEEFLNHVVDCIKREFEIETRIIKQKGNFIVELDMYRVEITTIQLSDIKSKGPYCLDKLILDQLKSQGFTFDQYRSQYIRYCFGLYYRTEEGTVY